MITLLIPQTNISGSLLEHVYVRQEFLREVNSDVISICFSDYCEIKCAVNHLVDET